MRHRSFPGSCFKNELLEARRLLAASWDGGGDGVNWTDPLNWSANAVPGPTDAVTISINNYALTVKLNSGVQTIASLTSSETIRLEGGELRAESIFNTGDLQVFTGASVLAGSGTGSLALTNGGTLTLKPGSQFIANGDAFFTGGSHPTLKVELASAASFGRLTVNGKLDLNDSNSTSTFDAVPLAGFDPALASSLNIVRARTVVGGFDVYAGAATASGKSLALVKERDVTTVYDAGGFEGAVFTAGSPLAGSSTWVGLGSTQITDQIAGLGAVKETKSIKVVRPSTVPARSSLRLFPGQVASVAPSSRPNLAIEWDSYVPAPTAAQTQVYGPMFGVEAYGKTASDTQVRLGSAGIDAKTGEVLFLDTYLTTGPTSVFLAFDSWHHFEMVLNPGNQTYAVRVNGQAIPGASAVPFQATASVFTDADITVVEAANEPPIESGTAFFDNYRVEWRSGGAGLPADELFALKVVAGVGVAPVVSPLFEYEYRHDLSITFSQDVGSSFSPEDVKIISASNGQPISPLLYTVTYQPAAKVASVVFHSPLPNGDYQLSLASGSVRSATGVPAAATAYNFFVLAGDINHNRSVDFDDLLTLAQNYGTSGRGYSAGNITYDQTGNVSFDDLLLLSQRYGNSLPVLAIDARKQRGVRVNALLI